MLNVPAAKLNRCLGLSFNLTTIPLLVKLLINEKLSQQFFCIESSHFSLLEHPVLAVILA